MLDEKKALLLIGSPKKTKSTSEALGSYLLEKLKGKDYEIEKLHIQSVVKKDLQELLDKVNEADIIILSFPLYVDTLPASVIKALEFIASDSGRKNIDKKQSFVTIINCGFPEAFHNNNALRVCRIFSKQAGFRWLGGLAMGCGPAIHGQSIEKLGMTRNIVKALDITAEAICNNEDIPSKAIELMSSMLIPRWLYISFGNIGWRTQAKKYKADKILYAKPYSIKE